MKMLLLGLFCAVTLLGCNSDEGSEGDSTNGGSTNGGSTNGGITLDSSTANQMAGFVEIGIGFKEIAVDSTLTAAGRSQSARNFDNCASETYTGDSDNGTAQIVYTNCSMSSLNFDADIAVSWADNGTVKTYDISGDFSMSMTADGQTINITFDPMNMSVSDDGSTVSTDMDFKFNYSDGTTSGYLSMETTETLIAPSSDAGSFTSGKVKMNDGSGNVFTMVFSGGSYTVQSGG